MEPAIPFADEPEDIMMEPDEPAAESPVKSSMLPLTPASPASDVKISTLPEVVCVLLPPDTVTLPPDSEVALPALITTFPPCPESAFKFAPPCRDNSPPADVLDVVVPAVIATSPALSCDVPTDTEILPLLPLADAPEEMVISPDESVDDAPVLKLMAPDRAVESPVALPVAKFNSPLEDAPLLPL